MTQFFDGKINESENLRALYEDLMNLHLVCQPVLKRTVYIHEGWGVGRGIGGRSKIVEESKLTCICKVTNSLSNARLFGIFF